MTYGHFHRKVSRDQKRKAPRRSHLQSLSASLMAPLFFLDTV